ncbi:MAG: T9SS type A sorting domain-containing protein, partial [Bacteroidales bacterium]|nr:T9SS type A sorting domain-containing protein [Bacteroidales bacterium]
DSIFPARFYGMWFWDEQTGYATGARNPKNIFWLWDYIPFTSRLYKTQDGGMSWQCLDTSHYFFNIRFVNQDTLFALEQTEHALYKSVDGGHTWDCVLSGPNLIDYSVVDSRIIYALQPTGYFDVPTPRVYKSSDGGETWTLIFSPTDSGKGPKTIDLIYFHEEGKGSLSGHHMMFTDDDFVTYDLVGSGFSSDYPTMDDNFQGVCLKSGFRVLTSLIMISMSYPGCSKMYMSRDFGRHQKSVSVVNPPVEPFYGFQYINDVAGCEADSTFFITTGNEFNGVTPYYNKVYRLRAADIPNVGMQDRPELSFSVSPNPVSEQFMVSCEVPFSRVEVYDTQGRIVHAQDAEQQKEAVLNAGKWGKGFYFIKAYTDKGIVSTKIVKL